MSVVSTRAENAGAQKVPLTGVGRVANIFTLTASAVSKQCRDMFSNKFSRLVLGLYGRTRSVVCGAVQSGAGRSGFSWSAVCRQRSLRLRSNGCPEMQKQAVSCLYRYGTCITAEPLCLRHLLLP